MMPGGFYDLNTEEAGRFYNGRSSRLFWGAEFRLVAVLSRDLSHPEMVMAKII
jgi:hypothetical protein